MLPGNLEDRAVRPALNPRGPDQARKRARRIGAAGEAEDVNLIAAGKFVRQEHIGVVHDTLEPEADRAAEDPFEQTAAGAHP
jgi:hypothetical protein